MKCSSLLKPSKITYNHHGNSNKQIPQTKPKMSSRNSTHLNERPSMADLMIMANPPKKSILSMNVHLNNKENQPKNYDYRQYKKELPSSKPNQIPNTKNYEMYLSDKVSKPSKLYRNMSMHISSCDIMDEVPSHNPRLNSSSMSNYPKDLPSNTKKRKLSKPLIENSSLLNVNHHRHNSVILSRSPVSDKNVLSKEFKDKKQDKANHLSKHYDKQHEKNNEKQNDKNYDSCKNIQSSRTIEQSKSLSIIGQKKMPNMQILHGKKQSMGLIKKNKSPKQIVQDNNSSRNPIPKTQSKSKSILVLKQSKGHETNRKIKRSKLSWLFIIDRIYAEAVQCSRQMSLYHLSQQLKGYEKKQHCLEEFILSEKNWSDKEQHTTLSQLLFFVKATLMNNTHIASFTVVFKPQSKQIDLEKTTLNFNNIGQILFSRESILKYLSQSQSQTTNIPSHSQHKIAQKNQVKQSPVHDKNLHNVSTKQDEDIVQTARFQENHHSHHHSRQSSDGINQKAKKKTIFMDPNHQQIYSQGIDLISAKLQKPSRPIPKRPQQHEIPCPSPIDKSFTSRKSSFTSTNKQQKSNGTTNKQISHCSIQDISEILQVYEGEKPLINSFNKKFYPSPIIPHADSMADPFREDSFIDNQFTYKNSNGMQDICLQKGMESGQLESCRIQALNMNSSLLFLESVILNNLYHTNFNISFSDEPLDNDESLMKSIKQVDRAENFNKMEDVIQEVENILMSMKNLFSLDYQSMTHNDRQFLNKNITKESIKIQDLTEMQEFLSQFIDYKVFRRQNKSYALGSSHLSQKSEYFNAVKLSEGNLTSFQTRKAVENVIKSSLISKYFSFVQGIRINQGPILIESIDKILLGKDKISKIRILNLSNNDLTAVDGLMNVIEANIKWLQFLNLSNNRIESIEGLFRVLINRNDRQQRGDYELMAYEQLRELHLKNNRISEINYKSLYGSTDNRKNVKCGPYQLIHFPSLQLLDLRSNMISCKQKSSIQQIIQQSPKLSIMSLKQNPIMTKKSQEKSELQRLLNTRSIYEYDSLQMMSAYIKYKDITFSDSGQDCCSLIEDHNGHNEEYDGPVKEINYFAVNTSRKTKQEQKLLFNGGVSSNNIDTRQEKQKEKFHKQLLNRKQIRSIKDIQLEDNSY